MTRYPTEALGQLCDVSIGRTPRRSESRYWGGPHPWATIRDLDGGTLVGTGEGVTDAALAEVMPKPVKPGTLLFSFKLSIGKMAFAGREMHHNEAIAALPVRDPRVLDREFLFHALQSSTHDGAASHAVLGKVLNKRKVEQIEIPVPPLDEQRRIVAILNRGARIERLRARAAERLREFVPALFVRMFGPQKGGANWPVVKIEDLVESAGGGIRTGPFGSQLRHSEFIDDGIPVLGIDNVVTNRFRWTKRRCLPQEKFEKFVRYRVFPDDVLITIMGTTGRVCVAPKNLPECMSTKHLCVLTLDQSVVEPTYVWGSLLFDVSVQAQTNVHAQGQVMEGWNSRIVRGLKLRIPPLSHQRRFTQRASDALSMAVVAESTSASAAELGSSLLQRLLGCESRVSEGRIHLLQDARG